ncbi:hypothetical protein [Pseudarthrobacter cellobiosi]|uniref:hypothetical protein n=1 Tax=Pseudarthrobacter cellobiosi TaxID=2953654 RepID=UPI00208E4FF8|nr:hypothetical protein [Pseudarthrobacter sp. HLT1-5]MCO4257344.1 hypothetical protein [Pseudarthrobacter sp. HLT1-5]
MTGPTLAALIAELKGDRSFRELKDRAASLGALSTLSSWQQWGSPDFERKLLPDPVTVRAFARGLGVSETDVLLAAARQVGLDVGEGNRTDLVLPGAGQLPPEDRNVLASLAAVLVAKGGASGG